MALPSTLYKFDINLSDIDRGIYESLELRVACHPSEERERLVLRVLARALAHEEDLEFGRGLSHTEDPALWTRSATGSILRWIDVGAPSADRLHRSSKRAKQVCIFTTKQVSILKKEWSSRKIHRSEMIEVIHIPHHSTQSLARGLGRKNEWYITVQDNLMNVTYGETNESVLLERSDLETFLRQN